MSAHARAAKKLVGFEIVSAIVVAAVATAGLMGVTSAGAQAEPIRVHIPAGVGVLVDLDGDGRIDTGDRVTGRSPITDHDTGDRLGRVLFDCVATTPIVIERQKGAWLCTEMLEFPEGHITLEGEDPAGVGTHVFAITGGTGVYRNARGEAQEVDSEDGEEITIHLEP